MSAIYDNWERLVDAVLKKQQLWELFHAQSSSPSSNPSRLSEVSDLSSSDCSSPGGTSSRFVLISNLNPAFDIEDVSLAFSELLGRGTVEDTYIASMENGLKIVVRWLNSSSVSERDFKRCMEIVGGVRHENVVPLRAYYSSEDERLTLYDYYSNGS